jgi:hypothetical protein
MIDSDLPMPPNWKSLSQQYNNASVLRLSNPRERDDVVQGAKQPGSTYTNPLQMKQLAPLSKEVKVVKALELLSNSSPERQKYWDNARAKVGINPRWVPNAPTIVNPLAGGPSKDSPSSSKSFWHVTGGASLPNKPAPGLPLSAAGSKKRTSEAPLPPKPPKPLKPNP